MVMEFRLEQGKEKLILPVNPPNFDISSFQEIIVHNINNFGEISKVGKKKLLEFPIKSFFPEKKYSFIKQKSIPKPYECTRLIEKWKTSENPIKLIITETSVNHLFLIESFTYGEKAGSRDVYFELNLKEYRRPTNQNSVINSTSNSTQKQKESPDKPKSYKVSNGDILSEIARKYYGDAQKWKIIADKNGIKDPKKLPVGKVLILP